VISASLTRWRARKINELQFISIAVCRDSWNKNTVPMIPSQLRSKPATDVVHSVSPSQLSSPAPFPGPVLQTLTGPPPACGSPPSPLPSAGSCFPRNKSRCSRCLVSFLRTLNQLCTRPFCAISRRCCCGFRRSPPTAKPAETSTTWELGPCGGKWCSRGRYR
jgi:hypothetical protein